MTMSEESEDRFAVVKAAGISDIVQIVRVNSPQLFVLRHPRSIPAAAYQHIRDAWKKCTEGTDLADVKVVILEDGMTLEIVDKVPQ